MSNNFALRFLDGSSYGDGPVLTVTISTELVNMLCIKQKKNNDLLYYNLDNLDGAAALITGTIRSIGNVLYVEAYNESSGEVLVKWNYPHSNDQIKTMMAIKSMLKSMQVIEYREN